MKNPMLASMLHGSDIISNWGYGYVVINYAPLFLSCHVNITLTHTSHANILEKPRR